jgi:osmoprotectant transport system permease protein
VLEFIWSHRSEVATLTLEHFWLVAVSIALATTLGLPLGVLIHRKAFLKQPILGVSNLIQTIPSLALFGLLLPFAWLGERADRLATVALTLYALLPIIRNTYEGLTGVEGSVTEAARGMGMTDRQVLWQVEIPLAMPFILAGIRVATVISIGTATIAAAIGAGGLGELIFRGLAMVDNRVILAGAVPAALLALAADSAFGIIERIVRVPRAKA